MPTAIDLFAGARGWEAALHPGTLDSLGVELDPAAVATSKAAGLPAIQGDVREFRHLAGHHDGLIASPPCQTFSQAGKGAGRGDRERICAAVDAWDLHMETSDPRTALVLEPLIWAVIAMREGQPYAWLAWEQVPPVLPIWEACARALRQLGYGVATGNLQAEEYGVAQTRKRAALVARLGADVALPAPTHRRYVKGVPRDAGDPALLPWVSMADALGWDAGDVVVSNYGTGGDPANRGRREGSEPSATVTEKVGRNLRLRSDNRPHCAVRDVGEPAPTILGNGARGAHAAWVHDRPATSVNCDPRIAEPGRHDPTVSGSQYGAASVRVTPEEAAALQSFPDGWPFQGNKGQRYQQIGNAIPPLLARAILGQVL